MKTPLDMPGGSSLYTHDTGGGGGGLQGDTERRRDIKKKNGFLQSKEKGMKIKTDTNTQWVWEQKGRYRKKRRGEDTGKKGGGGPRKEKKKAAKGGSGRGKDKYTREGVIWKGKRSIWQGKGGNGRGKYKYGRERGDMEGEKRNMAGKGVI